MTIEERLNQLVNRNQLSTPSVGRGGKVTKEELSQEVLDFIAANQMVTFKIPKYEVVTNTAGGQDIANFQAIIDDLIIGNNVYLYGPAGTGKTQGAYYAAEKLGTQLVTINCSQWTSPRDIIGGETITGYKEGLLIDAWKNGKLLLLDELPKLDPNTAGLLNDALAKTGISDPTKNTLTNGNGEVFSKHPRFACIAAGNTTMKKTNAKYGGNNRQDASLIDRFAGSYYKVDFNRKLEKRLAGEVVFSIFDELRNVVMKQEIENDITLRVMLNAHRTWRLEMDRIINGNDIEGGKTLRQTIESYFQLHDEDTAKAIKKDMGSRLDTFLNTYKNPQAIAAYKKEYA